MPAALTAPTPSPTTLAGKSSTIYTRNNTNSVAIANLKKKMTTNYMTLSTHITQPYGFLTNVRMKEEMTAMKKSTKPAFFLLTLSM